MELLRALRAEPMSYALRRLRSRPGFSVVVILTLALGFGANTAIFSLIRGVLLTPVSYNAPERLALIFNAFPEAGDTDLRMSPAEMEDLSQRRDLFTALGGIRTGEQNALWTLEIDGRTERTEGAWVTANLFDVLGVEPELGRTFTSDESVEGRHRVMVLSGAFWRNRFGADPTLVGRSLRVRGEELEVVGVMPLGFGTDLNVSGAQSVDYWIVDAQNPDRSRQWWGYNTVARLAPGVTVDQVDARLSTIADGFAEQFPEVYRSAGEYDITAEALEHRILASVRMPLLILSGSVALVLLIACMNVANLLMIRAEETMADVAVRVSLGASQADASVPFLVETGLLTAIGGALGLLFAWGAIGYVRTYNPGGIPRISEVHLDPGVLVITGAVVVATGLLMSLVPVLRARSVAPADVLKSGSRGRAGGGGGNARVRQAFVVAQVAVALVLTIGGGLLLQSFRNLVNQDLGIRPESVASMRMDFPTWQYPDMQEIAQIQQAILERTASVRGMSSVAMAHAEHPLRLNGQWYFAKEGAEEDPTVSQTMVGIRVVSANYLETLGTPLLSGRTFDERDRAGNPFTIVVNSSLAKQRFPGENPVGHRLKLINAQSDMPPFEIVGVIGDVKNQGIREQTREALYLPLQNPAFAQGWTRHMTLHGRSDGDPKAVAAELRAAVAEIAPALTVYDVRALDAVITEATATPLFLSVLTSAFALLALFLALLGTYGIVSASVLGRTQEFGVRIALGAAPSRITQRVVGEGLRLGALGLAVGIPVALMSARTLNSVLFDVVPQDWATLMGVSSALIGMVAFASYFPARRASRIEPVRALAGD
jgi:putative ABC transport system permease protein